MNESLVAFALTSLAVELTPGPNMAWLALLAAQRGRIVGLAAVAGVAGGLLLLGIVAGIGFGTLVTSLPLLYQTVRWAGVAFLLYLAWESWRDSMRPLEDVDSERGALGFFQRGIIANLLNPKAALFFAAVLPGYVAEGAGLPAVALLTGIYVAIATLVHTVIVLASSLLKPLLTGAGSRRVLGVTFAALLIGVAGWLAWSTRLA